MTERLWSYIRQGILCQLTCLIILLVASQSSAQSELLLPEPLAQLELQSSARIELGQMLFFDRRLSGDGTMSCAACHIPDQAYSDGRDISGAYPTNKHWRNTQGLLNAAYLRVLLWDGRSDSLEHQAQGPLESPFEMNSKLSFITAKLAEIPGYQALFQEAYGAEVSPDLIQAALAAFEQTLIMHDSPFDRYLAGENQALDDRALAGMKIFFGPRGGCSQCHSGPLLSDQKFYNLGVAESETLLRGPQQRSTRRYMLASQGLPMQESDPGRYRLSKNSLEMGAFRTSPLRHVAQTGPYMHNGSLKTLSDVITFFSQGGGNSAHKTPLLKNLNFNQDEQAALVAFLQSLSGTVPEFRQPLLPGD
ncbi:MAG: cytochrome-c peroxidase [Desulfuromonadales bacterium]